MMYAVVMNVRVFGAVVHWCQLKHILQRELHDSRIECAANLSERVGGEAQTEQRCAGRGEHGPEAIRDVISLRISSLVVAGFSPRSARSEPI